MNDDFLYRLRVEPSPAFAARLKARLDEIPGSPRRAVRWGLATFILGTALAFALPDVRHAVLGFFDERPTPGVEPAPLPAVRAETPPASKERPRDPAPAAVAPREPAGNASRTGSPMPAAGVSPDESAEPVIHTRPRRAPADFGFIASTPPMPESSSRTDEAMPHSSTMLDEARDAIVLRRSVCRVLGFTVDSLGEMLRAGLPLDTKAAATGAKRIQQVAPLIRETFAMDTRGFRLETRALDRIWQDPRVFGWRIDDLVFAAPPLESAARSGNPVSILKAVKSVVDACDKCHDAYRRNDPAPVTQ